MADRDAQPEAANVWVLRVLLDGPSPASVVAGRARALGGPPLRPELVRDALGRLQGTSMIVAGEPGTYELSPAAGGYDMLDAWGLRALLDGPARPDDMAARVAAVGGPELDHRTADQIITRLYVAGFVAMSWLTSGPNPWPLVYKLEPWANRREGVRPAQPARRSSRGECRVCGRGFSLRADGRVRRHGACAGGGERPRPGETCSAFEATPRRRQPSLAGHVLLT